MARKRVVEAPSLHSWEDVNDALRQIAEAQIALGEIQSDMQKQILGAQKVAEEQSKPLNDNVAKLEREIKSFVTDHRDEMGKTKSVVLTFGEVVFIAEEQAKLFFINGVGMTLLPRPPDVSHRIRSAPQNRHRVMVYNKVCNLLHHALSSFLFCRFNSARRFSAFARSILRSTCRNCR